MKPLRLFKLALVYVRSGEALVRAGVVQKNAVGARRSYNNAVAGFTARVDYEPGRAAVPLQSRAHQFTEGVCADFSHQAHIRAEKTQRKARVGHSSAGVYLRRADVRYTARPD